MSETTTYPVEFLTRMKALLQEEYPAFVASLDTPSPTSIRLNLIKATAKFDTEEIVEWCTSGRYLKERPSFTFDPLFHAGTYYVQEASSMFLEQVWKQINKDNRTVKVLDLCAAPGGKSTHLLSLMNKESLLVSNEVIPNRNKILQQNVIKWGNANVVVTQNKAEDFTALGEYFDIILIDAPCSGEGLFRKDKEAIEEWSEKNVTMCTVRQKDILKNAMSCLKPGGYLIYSTCTFEPDENDDQIKELATGNVQLVINTKGVVKTEFGYQFYPHRVKGEGLYMAVLKKEGEENAVSNPEPKTRNSEPLNTYLTDPISFSEFKKDNLLFAIPKSIYNYFLALEKQLYIRNAGIFMGEMKGKDFLPSHDLALSNHIRPDIPSVELSYDDAIIYLRGETPKIKTGERGWCLAKYENRNLGWMKILDNRLNNYFPKDWRILKR